MSSAPVSYILLASSWELAILEDIMNANGLKSWSDLCVDNTINEPFCLPVFEIRAAQKMKLPNFQPLSLPSLPHGIF